MHERIFAGSMTSRLVAQQSVPTTLAPLGWFFKQTSSAPLLFKTFQDFSRLFKTFQDFSRLFKTFQDFSRLFKTFQDFSRLFTKMCLQSVIFRLRAGDMPQKVLFGPIQGRWLRHNVKKNSI
jgi:hypothetical protein